MILGPVALAVTIGLLDVWGARTTGGRMKVPNTGISATMKVPPAQMTDPGTPSTAYITPATAEQIPSIP